MNTRQYCYLSTIAESGSLSHAAQALGLSPSALSKFLTECERTFGTALFLRHGRRLIPTAAGQTVIDYAQKILDEQSRMLLTMKNVSGSSRKCIRLATAPNRGATIYSRIYKPFSRRYPDIALNLVELYATEQPSAIARGMADLALGAGEASPLTADVPIAYEELLISLPAAHPLAGQERIRLADLQETPFVLQGPRHSIRILADQLFREADFRPVCWLKNGWPTPAISLPTRLLCSSCWTMSVLPQGPYCPKAPHPAPSAPPCRRYRKSTWTPAFWNTSLPSWRSTAFPKQRTGSCWHSPPSPAICTTWRP